MRASARGPVVLLLSVALGGFAARLWAPADVSAQVGSAVSQSYRDYKVTFEFSQNNKEAAPDTSDQLTVLFSNRSIEGPKPPKPFFGDDILQEFSFSGSDVSGNPTLPRFSFTRRVLDKSFLGARFIRVVNHGGDGWAGDQISLTVDGEEILKAVRMAPRRGPGGAAGKGFQNFNPRNWGTRSYWEAELQPYRNKSRQGN
jgi:hypothetical protein